MFNAVIREEQLKSVEVVAQRKGAKDVVFTIKLDDARISSCSLNGSSEATMNESLTFEGVKLMIRHEVGPKEISWNWQEQQTV
jgi:type VI protein secretion system component Hcp